jgi:membrane protease subunit HflK
MLFTAAMLGAVAFVAFVAGRLVGALADERETPLLQPASDWLLLTAATSLLAAAALLLARTTVRGTATWEPAPAVLAGSVAVVLWVAAADQLVTLVLEAYRARAAGLGERAPYETRLLHLATHPRGLVDNLAGTLDYQFGWRISGTDLYQAAGRALLPFLLLQLTALWLLSAFAFLGPDEQGLRERFGRPVAQPVLGPGLHLLWPWPAEHVRRYPANRVQTLAVGWEPHGDGPGHAHEGTTGVVAWSDEHDRDHVPFLVATAPEPDAPEGVPPVSMIAVAVEVHYRVTDLARFAYGFRDGAALLDDLARREATRLLVGSDVVALMGTGRAKAGELLEARLAKRCDELGLGVELVFVGFLGAHPPAPVMPAYEGVTAAAEQAEAEVLGAEATAVATVGDAGDAAAARVAEAAGEGYRRRKVAAAESSRFQGVLQAAQAAPEVYRTRRAVDARRRALTGKRKIIVVAEGANEVIIIDLRDKVTPELLDTPLPPLAGQEADADRDGRPTRDTAPAAGEEAAHD